MRNVSTRGYFNSAQALADFAEVLLHIKTNLSAPHSPIIVVGGSYGGSKTIYAYYLVDFSPNFQLIRPVLSHLISSLINQLILVQL